MFTTDDECPMNGLLSLMCSNLMCKGVHVYGKAEAVILLN